MRIACADIPALPLQLVWRRHPEWRGLPVVVVEEDRPQGEVLWACERARRNRVLPGQRYAHALSLCRDLRAEVVAPEVIAAAVAEIAAALRRWSPEVEPAPDQPGTFWLDAGGLERLFPDLEAWAREIHGGLGERGLISAVVVGFTRFATYALARARRRGVTVIERDADERRAASEVPLERLDVDPKLRDALARLGVTTIGAMVRLPGGGILERFGVEAHRLYQLATNERWDPLVPEPPPDAPDERVLLDDPEIDVERLVFAAKGVLDRLLVRLAARRRALTALHLELTLQHAVGDFRRRADCIRPAQPTLDGRSLLRLVHLRLEGQPPVAGVVEVRVWADDVAATREQLALFVEKPRRDLRAAGEALARLRAEMGDDAVLKGVVRDGHLPEARFGWERFGEVTTPRRRAVAVRPLCRRVQARPVALAPLSFNVHDDGWLLSGLEHGAVVRIVGPYVVSGGWWSGGAGEVHREYNFVETRRGDLLWLYYDRRRRRWFQHGAVE